jgi:phosphoribosylformylglycinamidine synthase
MPSKLKPNTAAVQPKLSIPKLGNPANRRGKVPKIIVEIMPKQDLLDPQGKAVANALHRSGHPEIVNARIGKRIELHFDREITPADMANAEKLASTFLSNDVIEEVVSITKE